MRPSRLCVVHILEAVAGGTQRHVRELSAALDPQRFRQTLILSPLRNPEHYADNIAPHVRVITLPMSAAISPWRDLRAMFKLARLLREIAPDVVHAHSSKAGALARIVCAWHGVPCVYTPHALAFCDTTISRLRRGLYRAIEQWLARWTTAFVALSHEEVRLARDTLHLPASRVHHIPNGTSTQYDPQQPAENMIGFLGRNAPQKGLDLFLRAAELLRKNFPDLHTLAVTNAENDVVAWHDLCHATVFVLPSRWEGLPYTLLDAMARGMAIVATRVGGMADVLQDEHNALLVPPENSAAIAAACERLLRDTALRTRLAKQAQHDAQNFGLEKMCRRYETLYRISAQDTRPSRRV